VQTEIIEAGTKRADRYGLDTKRSGGGHINFELPGRWPFCLMDMTRRAAVSDKAEANPFHVPGLKGSPMELSNTRKRTRALWSNLLVEVDTAAARLPDRVRRGAGEDDSLTPDYLFSHGESHIPESNFSRYPARVGRRPNYGAGNEAARSSRCEQELPEGAHLGVSRPGGGGRGQVGWEL
jgi:hypothetical protein